MKRGLLLWTFLVLSLNSILAQSYKIEIKNLTLDVDGDQDVCQSWVKMTAEFYGGTPSKQFLYYDFGSGKGIKTMDDVSKIIYGDLKSVRIQTYTNEKRDRWPQSDDCGGTEIYPEKKIYNLNDVCSYGNHNHFGRNGGEFEASNEIDFDYEIYPLIELKKLVDDNIGYDKEFNLSVKTNSNMYASSVYSWQYHVEGDKDSIYEDPLFGQGYWRYFDKWRDMPYRTTHGKVSFNIIPKDFLEVAVFDPKDVINKKISFRINSCGNNFTDPITYTIRKSAPSITNRIVYQATCYQSSDAYVRVFFERQLDPGESISYVLYDTEIGAFTDETTGEKYYVPVSNNSNITTLVAEEGAYYLDITGIPPSENYKFEIIGFDKYNNSNREEFRPDDGDLDDSSYEGAILYTGDGTYALNVNIPTTEPVEFTAIKLEDISCNGAANGKIELSAKGGLTGSYKYIMYDNKGSMIDDWTNFSNGTNHTITIEQAGKYNIFVKDSNGCEALKRDANDSITSIVDSQSVVIQEPLPLEASIIELETKEPRAYGFTNGIIAINITGGNHNNSGFTITWFKDGNELTSPNVSSTTAGKDDSFVYTERLLDIGKGTYVAKITDSKGCETSIRHELDQPDPLSLSISVENPISCNSGSTDSFTKTEDGHLKAVGSGGVGKYIFTWKKQENGVWKTLYTSPTPEVQSKTTDFVYGIGAGTYAVNVEDENGIVIGNYVNNILVSELDEEFVFEEPDPIVISIASLDVFCKGGNNAWIEATVKGGTLRPGEDYSYQWSNGQTTNRIENLIAGEYILTVTDSNGCFEIVTVSIEEPKEALQIELFSYKQPKANGLTDGTIQYKVYGGTPLENQTYIYQWTDEFGKNLNAQVSDSLGGDGYYIKLDNIAKGTYFVTVTDANYSKTTSNISCIIRDNYFLNEPEPLELFVEETKVISCNALNDYGNPFSDGAVTAHAKGGVQLQPTVNNGLPYYYTWKKKDEQGVWQILTNQTDSTATNLDAGAYAVNIKDANGIVLGTYGIDNQLKEVIDTLYNLKEPPLLEISTTQQNVYCFAGSDAWAEVHITGGTAPYTVAWSNGDTAERATELSAGTYQVHVIDSRGCEAITEVIIYEPEAPVVISYPQYNRPTHIGANDAWIEAVIKGGTPMDDGTYAYMWEDEQGRVLNDLTSTEVVNDTYVIRLNTITSGTYYLSVQDKNYDIATTKAGCTHAQSSFVIYEPIEATIAVESPISCNTNNEYQDPFSDGSLVAHIKGGVPFETGLPYIYHWKKQNEAGEWVDLTQQLDSVAINLNDGTYGLNVEDSRGTVMGTYRSDNLIKATDSVFYFKEPELLELSFTTTEVNCDAGNDGSAMVHISGGIPPYNIKWSNGETTQEVSNLIGGTYFVFVTDSRGCEISANVVVDQPGGLQFDVVAQKNPTCFEGNDGVISINVTGGLPPYQYQWNTGETSNALSELPKGTYTLRIIDSQGCIAYKEVVLEDPEPIIVKLGEDRSLCNAQEVSFDVTIEDSGASYYWESDNGFTSTDSKVTLTKEGIYTVTVTSALGCIGTDQIEIKQSNLAIDADFLITSQAFVGEEVVLVNVSSPLGEGTEWYVPDGVTIVSQSSEAAILKFKEIGSYEVRLRTIEGDCYQDYTKQIVVEEPTDLIDIGEAEEPFLKEFLVHPNPSNGNFRVEIQLSEIADLSLRMINLLTANISDTRLLINRASYSESYNITVAAGVYILLLETPKGNQVRRVIIK